MLHKASYFDKDNGVRLPVGDKYLTPLLSPTTKGTHFRESPPAGPLSDRQKGRVLLQIHQILHLFEEYGVDLKNKSFLDIGTGNGLIPCMMLELSELNCAVGADPYLDAEHTTSWQTHDHNKALQSIRSFLDSHCIEAIDYSAYQHLLEYENYSMIPRTIPYKKQPKKQYKFIQLGAHHLEETNQVFDILYCKAIEHIQDWDSVFKSIALVSRVDSILYFKHRSFFSYLGAHRYSTIGIPWGHLLLSEQEYERFTDEFYPDYSAKMKDFYFQGLTYPRQTISDMIRIAVSYGFAPITVVTEPTRYIKTVCQHINDIDDFWEIIKDNHSGLSADEVLSGMYHLIFRRIS